MAAFELDLDATIAGLPGVATYEDVTSYPAVREDLAVIVPDQVAAQTVIETVRQAGGQLLARVEVFDSYRDPGRIGQGNVSLALHLEFRAPDRTLTDAEVGEHRAQIVEALGQRLGGRVRDA